MIIDGKEFIILLFTHDAKDVVFNGFGVIQWFFTCLFLASIFSWIIIWLCNKISPRFLIKIMAIVFLVVLATIFESIDFPNIIGLNSAILGCAFFMIGNISRRYFVETDVGIREMAGVKKILLSLVLLLFIWCLNGSTNMRIPSYNNIVMYMIGALSGTYFIIIVSLIIERNLKINWLFTALIYEGQNTVIILSLNRVVQKLMVDNIYNVMIYPFFSNSHIEKYVYGVCGIAMEMIIFIPVIYVVNKFIPFSVGKKYKK